jgi:hypothetical protein
VLFAQTLIFDKRKFIAHANLPNEWFRDFGPKHQSSTDNAILPPRFAIVTANSLLMRGLSIEEY